MRLPACLAVALSACCLDPGSLRAEGEDAWPALKAAWAAEHLKLADELLKAGCIGFADTQAGLAEQLAGAEAPGVKAYEEKREKVKLPDKGWVEADWKAYEVKRIALHRKEGKEAAGLLAKGGQEAAAKEIETWALRLDPDQAEVRKRRGEEKVPGLGWLPAETAKNLKLGKVRFGGAWEKPDQKKYVSWDKHYEIPTEHFLLKTTISPEKAMALAVGLESEYRIWEEIFEGVTPIWKRTEPPVVWMLETHADYRACVGSEDPAQLELTKDVGVGGFALVDLAFLHEELPAGHTPSFFGNTYHECSHLIHAGIQTMSNGGKGGGGWCEEGMAMLLEPLQTTKAPDWNGIVQARTPRGLNVGMNALDTLSELFGMDATTFMRADGLRHYAQSYILTHFLMYGQGGSHRRDLLRCLLVVERQEYGGYDASFHQMPCKDLCALAKAYALKTLK